MSETIGVGAGTAETARDLAVIKQEVLALKGDVDDMIAKTWDSLNHETFFKRINRLIRLTDDYAQTLGIEDDRKVPFNLDVRDTLGKIADDVNEEEYEDAKTKVRLVMKALGMSVNGGKRRKTRKGKTRRTTRKSRR